MQGPRTLPHNLEAERSVLGSVLLNERILSDVVALLRPDDFYVPAHRAIFSAMVDLSEEGQPADVITLEDRLRKRDELSMVGGIEALSKLADRYATSHNALAHAKLVQQTAQLRSFATEARELSTKATEEVEDVGAFLDDAQVRILEVSQHGERSEYQSSRQILGSVFASIRARLDSTSTITGVGTGYKHLDELTAGLQPQDLIIIAARPSMGKTAFALNIAQRACIPRLRSAELPEEELSSLVPVLFFSLEMGPEQLIERILCSEARVDYAGVRRGVLNEKGDINKLVSAAGRLGDAKLYIDSNTSPSVLEIRNVARRWRNDKSIFPDPSKPGMIVVDYLQLCRGARERYESRAQEITEISRGLKALAREVNCPVLALSQLNRAVDARSDHRPMLSDLRESGAIEQDADVIMFIYRGERYLTTESTEEERAKVEGRAEVILGKQRNGPIGVVNLNFIKRFTRFEDPAPDGMRP